MFFIVLYAVTECRHGAPKGQTISRKKKTAAGKFFFFRYLWYFFALRQNENTTPEKKYCRKANIFF
jgi:hypothetical protein